MTKIKLLTKKEIPQVIELSTRIFDPILQGLNKNEDKKIWWDNYEKNGLLLGAYSEDILIGFIFFFEKEKGIESIHCWMTGVEEAYRGKGVLSALMNEATGILREKGYKRITVSCIKEKSPDMYSYLRNHNFTRYKEEQKDWHGEQVLKIFFWKSL